MAVPATVLYSAYDEPASPLTHASAPPRRRSSRAPSRALVHGHLAFELVRTIAQSGDPPALPRGGLSSSSSSSSSSGRGGAASVSAAGLERRLSGAASGRSSRAAASRPSGAASSRHFGDVPFSALYWFAYEQSKARLVETFLSDHPAASPLRAFVAGAGAGMLAAATTTRGRRGAGVLVRRRLENEGTHAALDGNGSTPRVLRAIIREEGVAGAFRGFNARLIKIAPACAIMISSYEAGKRAFGLVD